jgi:hypothetical protein
LSGNDADSLSTKISKSKRIIDSSEAKKKINASLDSSDQELQPKKSERTMKSVRTFKQLFKIIKEEDEQSDSDDYKDENINNKSHRNQTDDELSEHEMLRM